MQGVVNLVTYTSYYVQTDKGYSPSWKFKEGFLQEMILKKLLDWLSELLTDL